MPEDASQNTPPTLPVTESDSLSKVERKRLKRAQRIIDQEKVARRQKRRKQLKFLPLWLLLAAPVVWLVWAIVTSPKVSDEKLVSREEVHWHARLTIRIKGQEVPIPANVGISPGETHPERMHTHATDNIVHVEKLPPVSEEDIKLKNFFTVWGKTLTPQCVLDSCEQGEGKLTMTVNGQENHEFGEYMIRDGDIMTLEYQ